MTPPSPPWWRRAWPASGGFRFRVHSDVHPYDGTFDEVDRAARSLAAALAKRGIGPGSVVAFQLPNWVEAGITFWAAAYLGAVVVPIVHFYGPKELDYILDAIHPDVVVTADRFGRTDYLDVYEGLLQRRPPELWLVAGSSTGAAALVRLGRSPRCSTKSHASHRPRSTPMPRRSWPSPPGRPATRRASCTASAPLPSRPVSSSTCTPEAGRRTSPVPPSGISSACSMPSSSLCSVLGRSI